MQRLAILILGILALGLLAFWCARSHGPMIEHDLTTRATSALAGLEGAALVSVEADGRDLSLEGALPPVSGLRAKLLDAAKVRGVRVVSDQLEERSGPRFSALGENGSWQLTGMLATSREGRAKQQVGLWLGADVEPDFVTYSSPAAVEAPSERIFLAALPHLRGIENATFTVTPEKATVRGFVSDSRALQRIYRALRHAAGDEVELDFQLTTLLESGDLKLEARHGDDAGLVLSGLVPEGELKGRVLEAAGADAEDRILESKMTETAVMPEGFGDGVLAALPSMSGLGNARVVETPGSLEVSGTSEDDQRAAALSASLRSSLPDYEIQVDVAEALDGTRCQQRLDQLLSEEKILFASGSHAVEAESRPLLRRLASTLRRCPGLALRIEGHTDSDGDDAFNLALSRRRAASVVSELTSRGVLLSRLTSEGFGESRPVADNALPAGKAANRRIEFLLQEGS